MPIGSGEGQEDKDKIIIYGAAEKARALWSET